MYSSIVPVLPAAGSVKPAARAGKPVPWSITDSMRLVMVAAVCSESTSYGRGVARSSTTPFLSSTLVMNTGSLRTPLFANTVYAEVSSSRFTSEEPSASARFWRRSLLIPIRFA